MPQASILELVCLFTWKIKVLKKKGERVMTFPISWRTLKFRLPFMESEMKKDKSYALYCTTYNWKLDLMQTAWAEIQPCRNIAQRKQWVEWKQNKKKKQCQFTLFNFLSLQPPHACCLAKTKLVQVDFHLKHLDLDTR